MKLRMASARLGSAAFAMALLLAGCGKEQTAAGPQKPEVGVVRPEERELMEWDEYVGRIVAVDEVEVRARVPGMLLDIHFEDGKVVQKGDLLFTIDPAPFDAALQRARAQVGVARARLELAQANLNRNQQLAANQAVSREEADIRRSEQNQAAATVESALAEQRTAELNLEWTKVTAPIGGRVSRHRISVGNLIEGGAANATLLTTIVAWDPVHVYFDVDERSYLKYARMQLTGERASSRDNPNPVLLQLSDEKGYPHKGVMDFVENRLDARTSTLQGRAKFANPDTLLQPGLFGRIRLPGSGTYRAQLIPDEAVGRDLDAQYVYVVNDKNIVEMRPIQVSGLQDDGLRIVRSGLQPNERIVRSGLQLVRPGLEVVPRDEPLVKPPLAAAGSSAAGAK